MICNHVSIRYVYGVNYYKKPFSIVKLNVESCEEILEMKYFGKEIDSLPSEPIFVENPNPKSEDDGVLLVMILSEEHDYLSILDAKNMNEIARAELPKGKKEDLK